MSETNKIAQLVKHDVQEEAKLPPGVLEQIVEVTTARLKQEERPNPFAITTWEEMVAWANRWARSKLCPVGYQGKPDDIIIAVEEGRELGLTPIQSLKSIAVVNGRATLYGLAIMALCKGRTDAMGRSLVQDHEEYFEGDVEDGTCTAVCIVQRRGYPKPNIGRFSMGDARRANLGNVHRQYPKDMVMWRARHRAFNAAFPDVLLGFSMAELEKEEADQPQWRMPMPERAWTNTANASPWLAAWIEKLVDEQESAWQWMQHLLAALKECPTFDDLAQLGALDMVRSTMASAPAEATAQVDKAFADAEARLGTKAEPPKQEGKPTGQRARAAKAAPAAQSAAVVQEEPAKDDAQADPQSTEVADAGSFDYFLLDAQGEPVGEPYTSRTAFISEISRMLEAASRDERVAIIEQNADAIDAAADPHGQFAQMVEQYRADAEVPPVEEEQPAWEPEAVAVPQAAGKPIWAQYCRDVREALAAVPTDRLLDWYAAQAATLTPAPQSTRMQVTKHILEYCAQHSLEVPSAITQPKPTQAAPQEQQQAEAKPDKDGALCDNFCAEIERLTTPDQVTRYSNQTHVATPFKRWERERPELSQRLSETVSARLAMLRAGA